ncbi:MAG TPA: hypothetical protein VLK29_10630 [Luteimonas sp.]|nr:hypothetical protein [Luteimonas sp.]
MKTGSHIVAVALWSAMALSAPATAQETSIRNGVITGIVPVQVAAAQPSTLQPGSRTAGVLGRALGRVAGRAAGRVAGDHAYEAVYLANEATQETVLAAAGAAGRPAVRTAYRVMVRFDDGLESSIQIADASHLQSGRRVKVMGSGAGVQILPQ